MVVLLIALCFAEAARHFTGAGGPYLYARRAFGPFIGFQTGWVTWLVRVTSTGAVSHAFAAYLGYLWPPAAHNPIQAIIISSVLLVMMVINLLGVNHGACVVNLFTIGKLLPLGFFVATGAWYVSADHLLPIGWASLGHFGEATLLLVFAFGGFEILTIPAEEATSPQRDIPRAILATMILVTVIYVLVQIVATGTLANLAESKTPLASACAQFLGPWGGTLITLGALVSTTGTNSGLMLAGPRLTYALAQHGQIPSLFAQVHSRFHTPAFSIVFYGMVALGITLSGSFIQLAGLSAIARLLQYIISCLALLRLRYLSQSNEALRRRSFVKFVPYLAVGLCVWLLFQSTPDQWLLTAIGVAVGCLLYLLTRPGSSRSQGAEGVAEPPDGAAKP
jgi:amino acid transporter